MRRMPPQEHESNRHSSFRLLLALLREPQLRAFRAHAVGKLDLRALTDVQLDLLPVPVLTLNFLAGSANRQNARQSVCAGERLLQFPDQLVFYGLVAFSVADVAAIDDHALNFRMIQKIVRNDFDGDPGAVGVAGAILDRIARPGGLPEF